MADDETHVFGAGDLRVAVRAQGAELQSIADARFGDLLWDGGPAWPRRSPVLFPIVGRLAGDALRVGGAAHRMGQHGFARDRLFQWEASGPSGCRLSLRDDAQTREAWPFAFRLELDYAVQDDALVVSYALTNPGEAPMPASLGAHPAFRWPLSPEVAPEAHRLVFERDEPAPIRRLQGGLIDPVPQPTPVEERTLVLGRGLFAADALIFDRIASRSVRYLAPGAFGLEIAWSGFRELGVWTKPDAGDFLCIEPWRGFADPAGFTGAFADKPGLMHIAPGATETLSWSVRAFAD